MSHLPWAIEHGNVAWWMALAALLGWSLRVQAGRVLRGARERARRARDGLGPAIGRATGLREGDTATLLGVFDAPSGYVQRATDLAATPVGKADHAPFLWLGDVSVTLRGPLRVLAGHRASGGEAPEEAIVPGRWVRARGTLRRVPDDGGAGPYRESRSAWEMLPDDTGSIRVASDELPRGASLFDAGLLGRSLAWAAALSSLTGVVGLAGLSLAAHDGPWGAVGCELAASVPFTRAEALRAYERRLAAEPVRGEVAFGQRLAIARLRGDCAAEVDVAMEHGRLGEARAAAWRCGLLRRAALASVADGRYDDASRAIERAGPLPGETAVQAALDADVHMLGGRDETAADALERASAHTTREGLAAMLPAVAWNPRAEALRCAADALRARHGDAAARAHLAMRARDALPHCALLWADLIPPGEARRAAVEQHSPHSDNAVAWLLLSAEGEGPSAQWPMEAVSLASPAHPEALVLNPTSMLAGQLPGLEEPVLARLRLRSPDARTGELRAWLELRAALYASAMGNSPQAIRWAQQAAADGGEYRAAHPEDDGRSTGDVSRAIGLRAGIASAPALVARLPRPTGITPSWLSALDAFARRGDVGGIRSMTQRVDAAQGVLVEDPDASVWTLAARGDGGEFVRVAQARSMSDEASPWMLLGARRLRQGHFELRGWVHWGSVFRAWERDPTERAVLTANRMLLASALGDDRLASELRERVARHQRALARRDIAVVRAVIGAR